MENRDNMCFLENLQKFDDFLKRFGEFYTGFNLKANLHDKDTQIFSEYLRTTATELRRKRDEDGRTRKNIYYGYIPFKTELLNILFQLLMENLDECAIIPRSSEFAPENQDERHKLYIMIEMELMRYVTFNSTPKIPIPYHPRRFEMEPGSILFR